MRSCRDTNANRPTQRQLCQPVHLVRRLTVVRQRCEALSLLDAFFAFAGTRLGSTGFQLRFHRRLQVVLALTNLLEDAGLLNFAFEALNCALHCFTFSN